VSIFVLALVLGKLNPEALLRVCKPLHVDPGNLEFAVARSADRSSGDRAKPFDDPKIGLLHKQQSSTGWAVDVCFIAQTLTTRPR
jgi:hypothetical protein